MANRVWLRGGSDAALIVSMPGFEVTSAPISARAFDSRFATAEILARGSIVCGWNSTAGVAWPVAQAAPPILHCFAIDESGLPRQPYSIRNMSSSFLAYIRADVNTGGCTFWQRVPTTQSVTFYYVALVNPGI